jgi:hypothetical protein
VGLVLTGNKGEANGTSAPKASSAKAEPAAPIIVDVSIPYNAAAMLAYNDWNTGGEFDESTFQKFQTIYEEKVVAQVTAKKVARDYELQIQRLQAVVSKADADLAKLAPGEA